MNAIKIPKELIGQYRFVKATLTELSNKLTLRTQLERAMILGNSSHNKVKIVFATDRGAVAVETTVWAATDSSVALKGGVNIPLDSIHEIVF